MNRNRFRPQLEALEDRSLPSSVHVLGNPPAHAAAAVASAASTAATVHRPITDFTNAQGTTSNFNSAVPGLPDVLGWGTTSFDRFALVDFAGRDAQFLLNNHGIDLGTTVSGTVKERRLLDGRALVTVNLHTRNALVWASLTEGDLNTTATLLFGARAQDVIADPSSAVLADSHLKVEFINSHAGAPLPDLVEALINGNPPANFELRSIDFQVNAHGTVHTDNGDTPGKLVIKQTGALSREGVFVFSSEVIEVVALKKKR
jgi:hypothetical protein